ncbi:MAG: Ig-like domain-containing protein [Myxococcaceae bacterium]
MKTTLLCAGLCLALLAGCPEQSAPVAPSAPSGLRVDPASPSRQRQVTVRGTAETSAQIEVFLDGACAGPAAASAPAPDFALAGLSVTVEANQLSRLSVRAVRDGLASPCSAPVELVHDDLAPAAPLTAQVTAVVSGAAPRARVDGTAEAGARVRLFANGGCEGAPAAKGVAGGGTFSLELAVTPNAETQVSADATDAAGNVSGCSGPPLRFTHDGQAPAVPVLSALTPPSPSPLDNPEVTGTAEPFASIRFFSDAACAVALPGTGVASAAGAFRVQVTVARNATTLIRATATDASANRSPCSAALPYTHDGLAPAAPAIGTSVPLSPSKTATSFQVPVTAEAGSTLRLYTQASCAGTAAFTQVAGAGPSTFTVAVSPNTMTGLSARATDPAGNVSACSPSKTLAHDDLQPAVPALTASVPASPSNASTTPQLTGTAEALSTVRVYKNATCTGTPNGSGTAAAAGTFAVSATVTNNSATSFYASATDAAGNVSPCSPALVYRHDNLVPAAPQLLGTLPPSPAKTEASPRVIGLAEAASTVRLYSTAGCPGLPGAIGTTGPQPPGTSTGLGQFSVNVTAISGGTIGVFATATDAAGNTSACSAAGLSYTLDPARGWSADRPLGLSFGADYQPSVVVTASGEVVAAWYHPGGTPSTVFTSSFTAGAWSAPANLSTGTEACVYEPRLVGDASGTLAVAWGQSKAGGGGSVPWAARRAPGSPWSAPELLDTRSSEEPDIALDGAGNAIVAWPAFVFPTYGTFEIHARLAPAGGSWGADTRVSTFSNSFSPKVALAPGGRAAVLYVRNAGTGMSPIDELWSAMYEPGTGWAAAEQRSTSYVERYQLGLGFGATGEATAAWMQSTTQNGNSLPLTSRFVAGTGWGSSAAPAPSTATASELQAAVTSSGEAVALWPTSTGVLWSARSVAGGAWTSAPLPNGARGFRVRLAVEPGGKTAAVWTHGSGYGTPQQLWFSVYQAGAWATPQLVDVDLGYDDFASVGINAGGRIGVVWTRTQPAGRVELHSRIFE